MMRAMRLFSIKRWAAGAIAAAALLAPAGASADDAPEGAVTFTKDVLPIFQQHCQSCHRHGGDNYTGMVAPMSLLNYDEARPWAKSIAREVKEGRMPPWHASEKFDGVFVNERKMTAAQKATIERWAMTGAAKGRAEDAPAALEFPDFGGWRIGEPDLVVKFEKPHLVTDDLVDRYENVYVQLTEEMLPESRWVKAIEWKGGSSAVHHIVGYALPPKSEGGGVESAYGLGSIAPGEEPMIFPDGYAKLLLKGSKIIFQMHYHKEPGPGTAVEDVSSVAFKFYPKDAQIRHFVDHNSIGNVSFEVPPGHPDWKVGAARVFEKPTQILTLHPHMHLRGKDASYTAVYPDGRREVLLEVPAWDFNWQTDYNFKTPKQIPAGTRIEYRATFDNSAANPNNPNPSIPIRWGGPTTDEMMLGFITYADSEARDVTIESVVAGFGKERAR